METENQGQKKSGATLWIVLLVLSFAFNIYQWQHSTTVVNTFEQKVDTLVIERVNAEKELADTKTELNKYQGISANLDSLLKEANEKVDAQAAKIKSISRTAKNSLELNKQLQEQLATLQGLRDEYLGKIDSLLMVNKQLSSDKVQLTSAVESLSKNLESTVNTASVLKAEYLKATSYKRKGNGKYVETAMAKRAHKLTLCCDILENKIAKQGEKTVYMKVTEPGGKPMGDKGTGSGTFKTAGGDEVMYAASKTISYNGDKQNVCMNYEEQKDKMFPSGTYLIEIYVDGQLAGASSYVMK